LDRIIGRILGESKLAKGWREGVMVSAAMMDDKREASRYRFVLALR
jgi:hypothetical protein